MLNPALEPRHNWRILLQLRAITIVGQAAAILFLFLFFDDYTNVAVMSAVIAIYALINGVLWIQLRNPELPGNTSYFLQLLLDVVELSLMFYFSGGATNPFIFYFLVPVSIAAVVLPLKYVLSLSIICTLAFSVLLNFSQPLPEFDESHMNITLSEWGMWFNFALSALFISTFLNHIVNHMRRQQTWLSRNREQLLQDEQVLAIATHAAGTAHELGTPLNSMKLIVEELIADAEENSQVSEDAYQLKNQIELCSRILRKLSEEATITADLHNENIEAKEYIEEIIEKWRILRPEIELSVDIMDAQSPKIQVDTTLNQALLNLLNNAADANPIDIKLSVRWSKSTVTLTIQDNGPGISNDVLERLGQQLTSTKDGMGIGFFLSNASVSRRGGTVALYPVEEGGTITEITLPVI
ncbi:ATP-binding protein [Marinomonas sp. 15G1-11]|uniref:histidine kinase n=1 Tax=Marinomonas phaeophyticola TaxID=3004091 RepID=A0ABT4JTC2_9GAMM|nr:ATP-binding protein [Marinomonas sp. 15G1-11]MCZ2721643.1 ATP-binding protein [Marinomonas sp. 15G1-11]